MKLYSDESGHASIRGLENLIVSCIARVEVPAAVWRKHRRRELEPDEAHSLVSAFESDYFGKADLRPRFAVIGLPTRVLDAAASETAVHGLRAYDAVQLASARAARNWDPDCATLACFDAALREAAAVEGFELIP